MAYITKERTVQLKEKERLDAEARAAQAAIDAALESARVKALEEERKKDEERRVHATAAKAQLEQQLVEREIRDHVQGLCAVGMGNKGIVGWPCPSTLSAVVASVCNGFVSCLCLS